MPAKAAGIQVSLGSILQVAAAVVLSYMLNQLLGMEAKLKAVEVRQEAQAAEQARQAESIKALWNKKKSKESE
jgi:hypothetical protein